MRLIVLIAAAVLVAGLLLYFTAWTESEPITPRSVVTADRLALDHDGRYEDGWVRVESEEGGFSVMMPGEPAFESKVSEYAIGTVEENRYRFKGPGVEFTVEFSDLPPLALLFGRRIVYRMAARHLLRDCGCAETDRRRIRVGLHRGADLYFEAPPSDDEPGRAGRAVFLLIDERLYVLSASVVRRDEAEDMMDDFFESFELTHRVPGRAGHKYLDMQSDRSTPEDRAVPEPAEERQIPEETVPR